MQWALVGFGSVLFFPFCKGRAELSAAFVCVCGELLASVWPRLSILIWTSNLGKWGDLMCQVVICRTGSP